VAATEPCSSFSRQSTGWPFPSEGNCFICRPRLAKRSRQIVFSVYWTILAKRLWAERASALRVSLQKLRTVVSSFKAEWGQAGGPRRPLAGTNRSSNTLTTTWLKQITPFWPLFTPPNHHLPIGNRALQSMRSKRFGFPRPWLWFSTPQARAQLEWLWTGRSGLTGSSAHFVAA